ncbi:28646_t:CDS:2, partial [Dentiscutata erythropus]
MLKAFVVNTSISLILITTGMTTDLKIQEFMKMTIIKRVELMWDYFAKVFYNKWFEEIKWDEIINIIIWMIDLNAFDEGIKKIFYIINSAYLRGRNKHVLDSLPLDKYLEKVKRLNKVSEDIEKRDMLDIVFLRDSTEAETNYEINLNFTDGDFEINEKFLYSDKMNINIGNLHEINKQSETNLSQISNFTNFAHENCEINQNFSDSMNIDINNSHGINKQFETNLPQISNYMDNSDDPFKII